MIHKKKCSKCKRNASKEVILAKYSKNKYGQYYYCRECNAERSRKYRLTESGRLNTRKATRKSTLKYPEKQKARMKIYWARLSGKIIRPNKCFRCKKKNKLEGHHLDYNKPLKIEWLCRSCHTLV